MTNIDKSLKEKADNLPYKPGVYIFKNKSGKIIYIGKAKNIKKRVSSYFTGKSYKSELIRLNAFDIEFFITNNEAEALLLEYSLIKKHKPRFNIQLKDDKSYPYIFLDMSEEFPGIYFVRKREKGKKYFFGPYPSAGSVRKIISLIEKSFKLKTCKTDFSKIQRACLKYQIGRCSAPCVKGDIKKEYLENVKFAKDFLEGKLKALERELEEKMRCASENLEFEKAASLRDALFAVKKTREKQAVFLEVEDADFVFHKQTENKHYFLILYFRKNRLADKKEYVFDFSQMESPSEFLELYIASLYSPVQTIFTNFKPRNIALVKEIFEKKFKTVLKVADIARSQKFKNLISLAENNMQYKAEKEKSDEEKLKNLKEFLKLKNIPRTIYGFDISHLAGCFSVASSVCFSSGKPNKSLYRRIKLEEGVNDDYKSIYVAVKKRLESDLKRGIEPPDLIIIDGGKGQLSAGKKALEELNLANKIDIVSIAKKEETVFSDKFPEGKKLDFSQSFSTIITSVRNESHRFANEYRKKLYSKKNLNSKLLEIPGIGEKTFKKLIAEFGSAERVLNADKRDLSKLVGDKLAEKIVSFSKHFSS